MLRPVGPRGARLRLGKESLRRLGGAALAQVRGGLVEDGAPDGAALVDDRRTLDLCPGVSVEVGVLLSPRAGG